MRNHLLPCPVPFLPPPHPPLSSQGMFSHQVAGQLWPEVPLPRAAGVKGRLAKHLHGKEGESWKGCRVVGEPRARPHCREGTIFLFIPLSPSSLS